MQQQFCCDSIIVNQGEIMEKTRSSGWLLHFCSFIAVILIGVSLLLSRIHAFGDVAAAFLVIANAIAYSIVAITSVVYVAKKKNIWLWLVWAASIVLIIISYVIK